MLAVSIVLELFSLWGCVREIRKVAGGESLWQFFRTSRNSELIVVLGEDIAALAGLALALVAILFALVTGNPMFDALGSMAVGVLLIIVAVLLSLEIKALITGEGAEKETEDALRAFLAARSEVAQIYNLPTLQMGDGILLAMKARMAETSSASAMVAAINRVEMDLRTAFPAVRWYFFEPDDKS